MERITKVEFADLFPVKDDEEDDQPKGLGGSEPNIASQFGWYHVLDIMSNGNILDQEKILDLPFKRVLFHLLYLTKKSESKQK